MSRYTPKHRKPAVVKKKKSAAKKARKKAKPAAGGAFACPDCGKTFRTEEALVTHTVDAHGALVDASAMTAAPTGMVRCPECGAPLRKRNLPMHLRFIHGTV